MKKNTLTSVILILLIICTAAFFYKRYKIPPAIDLPVMVLTDLSGDKVSLSSYSGNPLFLNFFATWCGPCIREIPELADLQSKLSGQGLQVICISDEPMDKLKILQSRMAGRLIILHSESKFHDIGIYTYPTNYIFNAQGKKVYEKVDPDDWESDIVVNKVKSLIQ